MSDLARMKQQRWDVLGVLVVVGVLVGVVVGYRWAGLHAGYSMGLSYWLGEYPGDATLWAGIGGVVSGGVGYLLVALRR